MVTAGPDRVGVSEGRRRLLPSQEPGRVWGEEGPCSGSATCRGGDPGPWAVHTGEGQCCHGDLAAGGAAWGIWQPRFCFPVTSLLHGNSRTAGSS